MKIQLGIPTGILRKPGGREGWRRQAGRAGSGRAELVFENGWVGGQRLGGVGIPTGILRNLRQAGRAGGGRVLKNNKILQIINYTKTTTKFYC